MVHDSGTEFSNMSSFILYPSPEEAFKMGRDIQKKEKLFYKAYDLYKHPMPNGYGPHTRSAVLRNLDHMSNRGRSFDTIRAAAVIRSSFR